MTHAMAINKSEIHEILQQLIRLKEISASELARRVNLPQPTIQRIISGVYKQPHTRTLKPIAEYFGLTINQLRGFDPIPFLLGNKKSIYTIPLLTNSQAITWPDLADNITEQVVCDINVGEKSFAMYMPDASMEPLIPKGSTLLIDPEKTPHHRSFIVVKIQSYPEVIIRQLITDAKNSFIKPLSPDLDHFKMTILNPGDVTLGVIVQVRLNCEEY